MRRAFRGKVLTARAGRSALGYLEDGLLIVGEDGRIEGVEPWQYGLFRGPVRDMHPAVIIPGLVDAHVHYPQTRVIGSASGPLLPWLERTVFPEEARMRDDLPHARAVADEFTARLAAAGTTSCAVFSSSSPSATRVLFEELDRSGLRALAGLVLMDERCPEPLKLCAESALAACAELADDWHGKDRGRLGFAITPRFALSCSRALMEGAANLARERGLFVQTHIAENPDEGTATLAAFPWASDYLDVYDQTGLLGERTLLAHAIHLSPSEWDRVRDRGARIAHCPDSNFFLGSGRMRFADASARGVRVALGTDVAAGRTFDVRRIMASAYDNAIALGYRIEPADLFRMGTLGGAEALGMDAQTGSLEPGKDADLAIIALPVYAQGLEAVLSQVVFGSDVARVKATYVRGRDLSSFALTG
jgi:guanine deaminase